MKTTLRTVFTVILLVIGLGAAQPLLGPAPLTGEQRAAMVAEMHGHAQYHMDWHEWYDYSEDPVVAALQLGYAMGCRDTAHFEADFAARWTPRTVTKQQR